MRTVTLPSIALAAAVSGCVSGAGVERAIVHTHDGLPIAYDVRGDGAPVLVFVHGWSSDREFWREQLDAFAAGHRVVALDLPGHGESGSGREEWRVTALGADVARLIEQLDLRGVILVGHSMGGPVSLAAAAGAKGRVIGVIGVDTLHFAEFEYRTEFVEQAAGGLESDFEGTMRGMIGGMWGPRVDPELVAWTTERALRSDRRAAVALLRGFPGLDARALLAEAGVPVRCVNAAPGPRTFPTEIAVNRRYADFDATLIDDAGHFLMLERPAEVNAAIARYVEELSARAAPAH